MIALCIKRIRFGLRYRAVEIMNIHDVSRRTALSLLAATPLALRTAYAAKRVPIGIEVYSVREEFKKDEVSTLQGLSKMGYEGVEFHGMYFDWTPDHAKEIRKRLDDLGMKCYSTHNNLKSFSGDGLQKAMELNKILGARYIVQASPGKVNTIDGWKHFVVTLNIVNEEMKQDVFR